MMHHHNLPVDYPEFVRAKESAKNASDVGFSNFTCLFYVFLTTTSIRLVSI